MLDEIHVRKRHFSETDSPVKAEAPPIKKRNTCPLFSVVPQTCRVPFETGGERLARDVSCDRIRLWYAMENSIGGIPLQLSVVFHDASFQS